MVIFLHPKIVMGGGETLIRRMAEWFKRRNEKFIILTEEISSDSKKNIKKLFNSSGVIIETVSVINLDVLKTILDKYRKQKENVCFFSFEHLFYYSKMIARLKKKLNLNNVRITIYVVNSIQLKKKKSLICKLENIYCKYIEKKIFIKLYRNHNIVYMDQYFLRDAKKYYGVELEENHIFRLPIFLNDFNIADARKRYISKEFNILTIARADFPFKGYIMGLIDEFLKLKIHYQHITLTIISYGKDENIIREKINALSDKDKQFINFTGQVEYDALSKYFSQANLFVGMGTTLLDAANYGVPAVIIHPYTYDAIAIGFFHIYPEILGISERKESLYDLIEKVINMSQGEYESLSKSTYRALLSIYNIEKIMPDLMVFIEKQKDIEVDCVFSCSVFFRRVKKYLNKI